MKLLVTGRHGQVARSIASLASAELEVITLGRPDLDITDGASIEQAIARHCPDIVISAAAYTAVDAAEGEETTAFAVNRDGARNVAAAAAAADLAIIHLSTDYVFSGDQEAPYRESDSTDPRNVYGRSKLAGETAVQAVHPSAIVLRTAWVYSPYGNNFLKSMLRLAGDRDMVRVVADQRGTPTYALDIAKALIAVASRILSNPQGQDGHGVFHMVAAGETTWAGFAEEIFRHSEARGGPSARVERIATSDYPTLALRPFNSQLDTTCFERVFAHPFPAWQDGVARCLDVLFENTNDIKRPYI